MKLKSIIDPHGIKYNLKLHVRPDFSQCAPTDVRLIFSRATLFKWFISKLDVKSAFLHTGRTERDVYVLPPSESEHNKMYLWLLSSATYELINANAKWKVQSYQLFLDLGMLRTP